MIAQHYITVRDYFASTETSLPPDSWVAAVYGSGLTFDGLKGTNKAAALAKWRFQCADAMIAAREEL